MSRGIGSLFSIAALSLGIAAPVARVEQSFDDFPPPPPKPKKPSRAAPQINRIMAPPARGSISGVNRRGGEHQHSREIERHLRQAEKRARKDAGG